MIFLNSLISELEKINKNKKDKSFTFPESFLHIISYIGYSRHLSYWKTGGIINATEKRLPSNPSYGDICKSINWLNINIKKIETDAKSLHFSIICTKS